MKMPVFERYIAELIEKSTIEVPVWNIEKARGNGKGAGWNYDSGNAGNLSGNRGKGVL